MHCTYITFKYHIYIYTPIPPYIYAHDAVWSHLPCPIESSGRKSSRQVRGNKEDGWVPSCDGWTPCEWSKGSPWSTSQLIRWFIMEYLGAADSLGGTGDSGVRNQDTEAVDGRNWAATVRHYCPCICIPTNGDSHGFFQLGGHRITARCWDRTLRWRQRGWQAQEEDHQVVPSALASLCGLANGEPKSSAHKVCGPMAMEMDKLDAFELEQGNARGKEKQIYICLYLYTYK